jgi:hypothetical protein
VLTRALGDIARAAHLLHDALHEIWQQPLLTRRPRAKPRERKGTTALARAIEHAPLGKVTIRKPTEKIA